MHILKSTEAIILINQTPLTMHGKRMEFPDGRVFPDTALHGPTH